MSPKVVQFRLGLGACVAALFLGLVGIPEFVSSPSNVGNIVLAPTFWPYVLCTLTGLTGLGLIWGARGESAVADRTETPDGIEDEQGDLQTWMRLGALGLIMVATMYALPRLGMVWTCMVVFAATAFLFRTRHPRIALVCAVLVPLGLYGFFAHVAGVAIPQGNYVRLP